MIEAKAKLGDAAAKRQQSYDQFIDICHAGQTAIVGLFTITLQTLLLSVALERLALNLAE